MVIGVLALQGDFAEHVALLRSIGVDTREVRTSEDLAAVDALILPGGESTVMMKLMKHSGIDRAIVDRSGRGMPILGTCAGAILLSDSHLNLLPIRVDRNAYGSQLRSFSEEITADGIGTMRASFIRAPKILSVGPTVRVLATREGMPVLVRRGNMLVACFHPELHGEAALHRYFLEQCSVLHK